jgi:serine/threonine-protein kinase
MILLGGFRADQLVTQLIGESDPQAPPAQVIAEKLKKIGPKVVPKAIDALAMSDKSHTMVFVDILAHLVSDKTLPLYREGLGDGAERVVRGTAWALSSSSNYNANALLDFFDDADVSKPALIEVLNVHKRKLSVHDLMRRAYDLEPKEKAALFKIIEDIVTDDMVPDLIARMGGKDPIVKIHLMNLLRKFKRDDINRAIENQLHDPNKLVRSAALTALAERDGPVNIERVARLLEDPDLDVQNKAKLPGQRAETRIRVHASFGRRGAERGLRPRIRQRPDAGDQGRRLVGPRAGRGRAGRDRRAESRPLGRGTHQGRGRGHTAHSDRDSQRHQGRIGGRHADPGH